MRLLPEQTTFAEKLYFTELSIYRKDTTGETSCVAYKGQEGADANDRQQKSINVLGNELGRMQGLVQSCV